jgi:DNA-binding transcriptional ArsR family regulator
MSAKYTFLAWDTPVNDASTKLALLQLANNANDNGFSYYSISKMAKACDMSDRTFMRKIKNLEELKVLTVERRSNRPSLYTLVGDEMGVTLCHLQTPEVTDCHAEVTDCHLVGDRLSCDPNSTPNTNPKRVTQLSYNNILTIYNESLSNSPDIHKIPPARQKLVKKFFTEFDMTEESFKNYLEYINGHVDCQWMFEKRPKNDGTGQSWQPCKFEYFISEKCYLNVKENL